MGRTRIFRMARAVRFTQFGLIHRGRMKTSKFMPYFVSKWLELCQIDGSARILSTLSISIEST